jgi:chromosomal replication initiation ATPase DnaA
VRPHATRAAFERLKREACAECEIDTATFDGRSRVHAASTARHLAWWRARDSLLVSYPQLGAWSGGRDPTTVWHGVQSLDAWLDGRTFESAARKRARALEYYRAKKARGEI